jgi:hypothetical protein
LIPHIHHIDGDRKNNKKNNLIILCPNCHFAIHKGVSKRRIKQFEIITKKQSKSMGLWDFENSLDKILKLRKTWLKNR